MGLGEICAPGARRVATVPVPRFLLGVPLLLAGIFLPAAGPDLATVPAGGIGMEHEVFSSEEVTVHQGHTLTMVNDSRWIHIIGAGQHGKLEPVSSAIPLEYRRLVETNDTYVTGQWNTTGTYFLTCPVHPLMTVKVVVTS
jgi:plastocyanin